MALDERHHVYLQSLMARGPISSLAAKNMYKTLFQLEQGNHEKQFFDFLTTINKHIDFLQFEVRGSTNQYDGDLYYGLINKLGNEQSMLGTHYSYAQIIFFKAVLEAIAQDSAGNGKLSSIEALNIRIDNHADQASQQPSRLSLAQREQTLKDLTSEKWLNRTSDGCITLGIRSFLELRSVFKNLDVPFCDVCNEAGIQATHCQSEGCVVRMHTYCAKIKFQRPEVPRICPGCGSSWDCDGLDLDAAVGARKSAKRERGASASRRK